MTAIAPNRVRTASGSVQVDAVVATVNPWEYLRLTGAAESPLRRRTAWTLPAFAPTVGIEPLAAASEGSGSGKADGARSRSLIHPGEGTAVPATTEDVHHTPTGVRVEYRLPGAAGGLRVVHDFTAGAPDPGFGTRWTSPRTWLRQPPLRAATPSVTLASASSRGGNDPWAQLLSAALASYVTHEELTGADIRPTNKAARP